MIKENKNLENNSQTNTDLSIRKDLEKLFNNISQEEKAPIKILEEREEEKVVISDNLERQNNLSIISIREIISEVLNKEDLNSLAFVAFRFDKEASNYKDIRNKNLYGYNEKAKYHIKPKDLKRKINCSLIELDSGKKKFSKLLLDSLEQNKILELLEVLNYKNGESIFLIGNIIFDDFNFEKYEFLEQLIKQDQNQKKLNDEKHIDQNKESNYDFKNLLKSLNNIDSKTNKNIGEILYRRFWQYFYPYFEKSRKDFEEEYQNISKEFKPQSKLLKKSLEYFYSIIEKTEKFSSKSIDGFKETTENGEKFDLRPYQKLLLARFEKQNNKSFIVDMSLGKTFLMLAEALKTKTKPIVVLCPSSLIGRWEEAIKFCTDLNYQAVRTNINKEKRKELIKNSTADILIGSIDSCHEFQNLNKIGALIVDEAHNIRKEKNNNKDQKKPNKNSKYKDLINKKDPGKIIIGTGTPFAKIDSLKDFIKLVPDIKIQELNKEIQGNKITTKLEKYLHHMIATHNPLQMRNEVREEKTIWDTRECKMNEKQENLYKEAFLELNNCEKREDKIVYSINALKIFRNLIRISNGLYPKKNKSDKNDLIENNGKLQELDNLVEEYIENGEKLLVFSSDLSVNKFLVKRYNKKYGDKFKRLDSSISSKKRTEVSDKFLNDKAPQILIGTPGVMGQGYNLESASNIIMYSLPTNAETLDQASARTDRPNQNADKIEIIILESVTSNNRDSIDYHLRTILGGYKSFIDRLLKGDFSQENLDKSDARIVEKILNTLYEKSTFYL